MTLLVLILQLGSPTPGHAQVGAWAASLSEAPHEGGYHERLMRQPG